MLKIRFFSLRLAFPVYICDNPQVKTITFISDNYEYILT